MLFTDFTDAFETVNAIINVNLMSDSQSAKSNLKYTNAINIYMKQSNYMDEPSMKRTGILFFESPRPVSALVWKNNCTMNYKDD